MIADLARMLAAGAGGSSSVAASSHKSKSSSSNSSNSNNPAAAPQRSNPVEAPLLEKIDDSGGLLAVDLQVNHLFIYRLID